MAALQPSFSPDLSLFHSFCLFFTVVCSKKNRRPFQILLAHPFIIVACLPSHFHLVHLIYQNSSNHFIHESPTHSFRHSFPSRSFYISLSCHSHSPYLVLLILHRISTSLTLSFFKQSHLWKLGVSLDKKFNPKYLLYYLKPNSDSITTPC